MEKKSQDRKWNIVAITIFLLLLLSVFGNVEVLRFQRQQESQRQEDIYRIVQKITSVSTQYDKVVLEPDEGKVYDVEHYSALGKKTYSTEEPFIEISNHSVWHELDGKGNRKQKLELTNVRMTTANNISTLDMGTIIIETPGVDKIVDFSKLEDPNVNVNEIVTEIGLKGQYTLVTSADGVPIALYYSDVYTCDFMDSINTQMIGLDMNNEKILYVQNGGVYNIPVK